MSSAPKNDQDAVAVENFRSYLKIPSVHPNVNYDGCVKFIQQQGNQLNLKFEIYEIVKNKPIVVLTWPGTNPNFTSILLNSHMDVVPVYPELWNHDPFGAEVDANGNIYARGSQDMKCVGIQYLEAIRRLQANGIKLKRTIHISFVPDEEIGGYDGMKKFVKTEQFKKLNVGFALDEGMASPNSDFLIFYAERSIWHAEFTIPGTEGHGSLLLENTAGEKLRKLVDKLMDFRQTQVDRLKTNPNLTIGDVTTINLTMLKGGVEPNVVPPTLSVTFDLRVPIDVNHDDFLKQLHNWMNESGSGIQISFHQKNNSVEPTKLDASNIFWTAMKEQFNDLNATYKTVVFPGGTDSRYCREVGIPVIGFSPINNTPVLLHANDEYLNTNIFLKGVKIYEKIIAAVANV